MKSLILCVVAAVLMSQISADADVKAATVDARKIFNEWSYSKKVQAQIEERKDALTKENNDRLALINQYRLQRNAEIKKFHENQAAMSDQEQDAAKTKIIDLGRTASALEQDRQNFYKKSMRILGRDISSDSKMILEKISEAVQVYALEKKFDMVIESGGGTTRHTPFFMYIEGAEDITSIILERLNKTQPASP